MESIRSFAPRKAQLEALAREQEELSEILVRRYADAISGKAAVVDPADARRELAARHAVSPLSNG